MTLINVLLALAVVYWLVPAFQCHRLKKTADKHATESRRLLTKMEEHRDALITSRVSLHELDTRMKEFRAVGVAFDANDDQWQATLNTWDKALKRLKYRMILVWIIAAAQLWETLT